MVKTTAFTHSIVLILHQLWVCSTLPIDTLILPIRILKIISFHDFPLKAAWASQADNGWPKQLWWQNHGMRQFSKLWQEGSMYLYVMCSTAWGWVPTAGWSQVPNYLLSSLACTKTKILLQHFYFIIHLNWINNSKWCLWSKHWKVNAKQCFMKNFKSFDSNFSINSHF